MVSTNSRSRTNSGRRESMSVEWPRRGLSTRTSSLGCAAPTAGLLCRLSSLHSPLAAVRRVDTAHQITCSHAVVACYIIVTAKLCLTS